MDRERFDALARVLAATGSRRGAMGALLGVALLGKVRKRWQTAETGKARPSASRETATMTPASVAAGPGIDDASSVLRR